MGVYERNRTVAALRGDSWRANLVRGKMEAQFYPSAIKIMRVKKLMSQYEMSQLLDISIASFGGIERGTRPAKRVVAEKIASILGDKLNKFFKEKDEKLFAITPKK